MSSYWVTFRIHNSTVNGETYEDRYDSLTGAIKLMGTHWDVPTSYIVFENPGSIDDVRRILTADLAEDYDVLMIGQVGVQSARIWGTNPDADIFKLMPYLKKA
jgi:hypothetical protein